MSPPKTAPVAACKKTRGLAGAQRGPHVEPVERLAFASGEPGRAPSENLRQTAARAAPLTAPRTADIPRNIRAMPDTSILFLSIFLLIAMVASYTGVTIKAGF